MIRKQKGVNDDLQFDSAMCIVMRYVHVGGMRVKLLD
jgi:hypothetical protein